jgi:hypothetical protein
VRGCGCVGLVWVVGGRVWGGFGLRYIHHNSHTAKLSFIDVGHNDSDRAYYPSTFARFGVCVRVCIPLIRASARATSVTRYDGSIDRGDAQQAGGSSRSF